MIQRRVLEGAKDGPHLLIIGGVHGDEFEPMAALRQLAEVVDPNNTGEQASGATLTSGKLTLVPVANESAFLRGTRCGDDDLDLARTCPGDPAGSVTQRTAAELSELIRTADYFIDLHTGGNIMDVWPLTGYKLVADADVLERQRKMARAFNLPLIWGTDAKLEGRTLSVARDAKIPTIYAEYLGSGRCDPEGVDAYREGCLNVMALLEMIQYPTPPSRVLHEVEDTRDGAGHMQVRNLAPATGFFEPAVELGQSVKKGDPLGVIADPLGQSPVTVAAQEGGIVIVLRTFSRVLEGESLGVVMETEWE